MTRFELHVHFVDAETGAEFCSPYIVTDYANEKEARKRFRDRALMDCGDGRFYDFSSLRNEVMEVMELVTIEAAR